MPTDAIVLTAAPGQSALAAPPIAGALAAWMGSEPGSRLTWLADGAAAELSLPATALPEVQVATSRVRSALAGRTIDINGPMRAPRRKRLLIADMESTIIQQEMLDELADYVGLRERIAGITERAMRGELDFEAAIKERVLLLKGLSATVLDEVAERMTSMPGAEVLVRTMKASGAYCALVSGGFTVFTARIAKRLGFDEHQANVLEVADGKLTGRVVEPILGREAKLAALQRLVTKLGIQPADTLAVGDGANDLAMLEAAGLGVAFRAKPKVREAVFALANGAVVDHGDLTALLYLQGYRRDQQTGPG